LLVAKNSFQALMQFVVHKLAMRNYDADQYRSCSKLLHDPADMV
jgi:hypothetical protein